MPNGEQQAAVPSRPIEVGWRLWQPRRQDHPRPQRHDQPEPRSHDIRPQQVVIE